MIEYLVSFAIFAIIALSITGISHWRLRKKYKKAIAEMQATFDRAREELDIFHKETMQKIQTNLDSVQAENEKSLREIKQKTQADFDWLYKELDSQYNAPDFVDTQPEPPPIFIPSAKDDIQTA